MEKLEKQLQRAEKMANETGGGILVITEGVYGMSGDLGNIKEIVRLKNTYNFRLLVDDAHGFGTMGNTGAGTGEFMGVQDGIDLYFGTFAKAMAGIGGFIASNDEEVIKFLRYNMRSQIYAKSLPIPMVIGALKRLDMIRRHPELREKLWTIVRALQTALKANGFNIGNTQSPVTPVFLSGNVMQAANMNLDLRENRDLFLSIVLYPVVPKGIIMLRLIPTSVHTLKDVEYTIEAFNSIKDKLRTGKYRKDEVDFSVVKK
jgi:glycine C-acetyltransferase